MKSKEAQITDVKPQSKDINERIANLRNSGKIELLDQGTGETNTNDFNQWVQEWTQWSGGG